MRHVLPFAVVCSLGVILNCSSTDAGASFSTAGDTAVMNGIAGTWTATVGDGRTYTLVLCEDDTPEGTFFGCETLHQVKGSGLGTTETVQVPTGGCGGCDYDDSAFAKGTIVGTDLAPSNVGAQFSLSGGDTDGSLGLPYAAHIVSNDTLDGYPSLNGTVDSAGALTLASFTYVPLVSSDADGSDAVPAANEQAITQVGLVFHRIGAATCPAMVTSTSASSDAGASPAAIAAIRCAVPASVTAAVDGADGATSPATISRVYLICTSGASIEDCASSDGIHCSDGSTPAGTCVDDCHEDEYAVGVVYPGGVGDSEDLPAPTLPGTCRPRGATPGGTQTFCCPCGS